MTTNNIQIEFTSENEFLHHGIQGQKWGIQNGPPYPLDKKEAKKIRNGAAYNHKFVYSPDKGVREYVIT